MSNELMLDVGQANELKMAFRRSDWTNQDIKVLTEGNILAHVRDIVRGRAEVKHVKHFIDCDTDPFTPNGWRVEEHKRDGEFEWNLENVTLYLLANQQNEEYVKGKKLHKKLKGKSVSNANVLDYLLKNPHLIPDRWKEDENRNTIYIIFWGTIYCHPNGYFCVRCLYWVGREWSWDYRWLDDKWCGNFPALLLTS